MCDVDASQGQDWDDDDGKFGWSVAIGFRSGRIVHRRGIGIICITEIVQRGTVFSSFALPSTLHLSLALRPSVATCKQNDMKWDFLTLPDESLRVVTLPPDDNLIQSRYVLFLQLIEWD